MIRSILVLLSFNSHSILGKGDPTCNLRNNGATPDAQMDSGREDSSEDGSFMQTRAYRQDKEKPPGGCGPDCPCDMGVCYFWGDPHINTFDGGFTDVSPKTGFQTLPMNLWYVYSKSQRIQGMVDSKGGTKGLAISGDFIANHTIILSKQGMTVDGTSILSEPGKYTGFEGLFEIYRHSFLVMPQKELMKEVDGTGRMWGQMKQIYTWFNQHDPTNYHIKLPYGQEMFISGNFGGGLQVVIKARPGPYQGGYCGNFNGHVEDDQEVNVKMGRNKNIGTMLDPIPADEDMFQKAGISLSSSMLQSDINNSLQIKGEWKCDAKLKAKADEACKSIPEEHIKQGCIMDICLTGDTSYANDAMTVELMNLEFAKGSVELQGQGHCLDSSGVKYSTVTAKGISTKTECIKMLHELAHSGMVDKGVRGAQFKDSCDIVIDVTMKNDVGLEEAIPFTLVGEKTDAGSGLVSNADKVEGVTCWKIMI